MPSPESQWLTLTQAARMLGVHPSTLRRWADRGDVPVHVTPGGHRRFLRADLAALGQHDQPVAPSSAVQVWGDYALVEARQRLHDQTEPRWLMVFDASQREEKRALGRRLLSVIMQHISTPDYDHNLLVEARSIAVRYAQNCVLSRLTAAEALEATLFFRDALTEVAVQMPQVAHLEGDAQLRLLRKINEVFNEIQVSVVEYYDRQAG